MFVWTLAVGLVKRDCKAVREGDFYRVFVSVCPLGEELDSHRTVVCRILYWGDLGKFWAYVPVLVKIRKM